MARVIWAGNSANVWLWLLFSHPSQMDSSWNQLPALTHYINTSPNSLLKCKLNTASAGFLLPPVDNFKTVVQKFEIIPVFFCDGGNISNACVYGHFFWKRVKVRRLRQNSWLGWEWKEIRWNDFQIQVKRVIWKRFRYLHRAKFNCKTCFTAFNFNSTHLLVFCSHWLPVFAVVASTVCIVVASSLPPKFTWTWTGSNLHLLLFFLLLF